MKGPIRKRARQWSISRELGSRREFLLGAAASSFALAGCAFDLEDTSAIEAALTLDGSPENVPPAALATFPLGVASGDITATGALLWTKYAGTNPLHVGVWEMEGDVYAHRVTLQPFLPAAGGFAHADVGGLNPSARHRYAVFETLPDGSVVRSPIGRFRAAFDPDTLLPLTFGAVSCTSNGRAMTTLERAGARNDIDLFCLLGDTTYNDGSSSLSEFRAKWAQNFGTTGYRNLRASTSLLATLDDHEVTNNFNPETISAALLDTALGSFFEHLPIRRESPSSRRIYRKLSWGKTADFFVLDGRTERKPSTRSSSGAQYLSPAQLDWLKSGLLASQAVFKVILNSVPITNFPGLFDFVASDRWEGYAAQRTALLSFIENKRIPGVLWVAGDFHLASAGRVSPSGVGSSAIEVLAGPGAQSSNILWTTLAGSRQFDFVTGTNNYTKFSLDPSARRVTVAFHNSSDSVIGSRAYTV